MTKVVNPHSKKRPSLVERRRPISRHDGTNTSRRVESAIPTPSTPALSDFATSQVSVSDFLGRHFRWPISLIAVMAARNIILSGLEALEWWFPGYGSTPGSDFAWYSPCKRAALEDICRVLNHAGVRWKNYLVRKLEGLDANGVVIVPCEMILSLAVLLVQNSTREDEWSTERLRQYLSIRFSRSDSNGSERVGLFVSQFCAQVEKFREAMGPNPKNLLKRKRSHLVTLQEDAKAKIWILDTTGKELSGSRHDVGSDVSKLIDRLIYVLDMCPRDRTGKLKRKVGKLVKYELTRHSLEETVIDATNPSEDGESKVVWIGTRPKINMTVLERSWLAAGLTEQNLREYLAYTIVDEVPHKYRGGVYEVVNEALGQNDGDAPKYRYGEDFSILRGVLPETGKKIRIIVDSVNRQHPMYTVLQCYATHPMSFIGGTLGAHLYYSTAKRLKSLELDLRKDTCQEWTERGMKYKYIPRGWKFRDMDRVKVTSRSACDQHTKTIDFEPIYATALRQVSGETNLPKHIRTFFLGRRNAFRSFTWIEKYGKIPKDHITSIYSKRGDVTMTNNETKINDSESDDSETDDSESDDSESDDSESDDSKDEELQDEEAHFVDWVHRDLGEHPQVIPETSWADHDSMHTALDVYLGGFRSLYE